jgi:hypothetical protein
VRSARAHARPWPCSCLARDTRIRWLNQGWRVIFFIILGGFIFGDDVFRRRRLCMLGLHRAAFLMI